MGLLEQVGPALRAFSSALKVETTKLLQPQHTFEDQSLSEQAARYSRIFGNRHPLTLNLKEQGRERRTDVFPPV